MRNYKQTDNIWDNHNNYNPAFTNIVDRFKVEKENTVSFSTLHLYDTYEEAREQAILKCIEL